MLGAIVNAKDVVDGHVALIATDRDAIVLTSRRSTAHCPLRFRRRGHSLLAEEGPASTAARKADRPLQDATSVEIVLFIRAWRSHTFGLLVYTPNDAKLRWACSRLSTPVGPPRTRAASRPPRLLSQKQTRHKARIHRNVARVQAEHGTGIDGAARAPQAHGFSCRWSGAAFRPAGVARAADAS